MALYLAGRFTLAIVIDRGSDQCRTYIDGTLESTDSISSIDSVANSFGLRVGAQSDNSSKYTGAIDELRIWGIARNANTDR